jgi:hypothetical protein
LPAGCHAVHALTDLPQLPLLHIDDLHYVGAFRLPDDTFGASSLNYSQGPLEYDAANHSIYVVGHSHHQAIAEFAVPALVCSTNIAELNMSGAPLQDFARILDRTTHGNPQNLDRIGGMEFFTGASGRKLLVNMESCPHRLRPGNSVAAHSILKQVCSM